MYKIEYLFSQKKVSCYFDAEFSDIQELLTDQQIVIITDEVLYTHYEKEIKKFPVIKFAAGEAHKNQSIVDYIIEELIKLGAHKNTFLIGLGGGVVTDITGYIAAVYMRGLSFGLVPTTVLAMVDAAIGGKNGIDVGVYKNMIGTIRQPEFIFYDYNFLETLPTKEWVNGFAEIIKHACIKDAVMFSDLEKYTFHQYKTDRKLIAELIEKNVLIKSQIVAEDEFEKEERKFLNFGHTIGHAIENLYGIPHGHAVSIGMVAACNLSEKLNNFSQDATARIIRLLTAYHLPINMEFDHQKFFEILKMDKKCMINGVHFFLLKSIGHAQIKFISFSVLEINIKEKK